ncbi:MAG: hypothetical protein EOO40_01685 [Deltaproteobacteria bacterium]|nr:MAG: hypothetical protein EOO40_01685 [Deltaproteobacteria bacterium]
MARTYIRPDTQIEASLNYLSSAPAGVTLQNTAVSIEDDLNALRVQVSRVLDASLGGNWYDDIATTQNGKKRSVKQLNNSLDGLETKTVLARLSSGSVVSVPTGQNYVVLSAATSQAPAQPLAIALTTLGAVTAQSALNGAAFSANELSVIAGTISSQPRNLCVVRDAATLQIIESNGFDIFALLQAESTATDGSNANDTSGGNRLKLSFVTINASTGNLQAAAAADIGGHSINFSYVYRNTLLNMPEQYFLGNAQYVDQIGDQNVTLSRAALNQGNMPVNLNSDIIWRIPAGNNYKFQTASGGTDLFSITPTATSNAAVFNTDTLAFNTTSPVTSVKGVQVASGGQQINIGLTPGAVSTAGNLTLATTGTSGAINTAASGAITWSDGYEAASTWTTGSLALSSSTAEWNSYKSYFGETSIMAGIVLAAQKASNITRWATITSLIVPAGTAISGAGTTPNLSVQLPSYYGTTNMVSNVLVWLNGTLMEQGASTTDTSADWYPVNSSSGDIKFTFPLRRGDKIAIKVEGNAADNA